MTAPAAPHVPPGERRLALAGALVTVVLWASAFVGIRAADRGLSAGSLALARLLVGTIALGVLVVARRQPLVRRADIPGLLVCGVLWFGAYNLVLNQAERSVDAGTAAMLVNTGPVFVAILSGLFLHEGFPRRLVVGCIIGFGGAVVIGSATSTNGFQAGFGALLCIAAALVYAGGVTAEKPLLANNSALTVTWLACTIGAVVCLPFAPQLIHEIGKADLATIAWAVYLGVVPTAVGFSLWAYALARTTGGRMGAMAFLVPPVAILLGWLILGAVPPLLALLGGVLCLVGVAVTRGARLPRRLGVRRRLIV
ncbi:MAG TPA: EamA family transporter [Candidatus Dormibacteraeota bacterium]